jgi:hypothetical protein
MAQLNGLSLKTGKTGRLSRKPPELVAPKATRMGLHASTKIMLQVSQKLKHTERTDIDTIFKELNPKPKPEENNELIIDMDYVIRFVGNRLIIEVFGYKTVTGIKKLKKPYIFYRSSGKSRNCNLNNIYFPSCLGEDHNAYVVSLRKYIDHTKKEQELNFISYALQETIGTTIPKLPESFLISIIENIEQLSINLQTIDFFTKPEYLNNKLTYELFQSINNYTDPSFKDINKKEKSFAVNIAQETMPFNYFDILDITLNDLLKYGRLLNKEIAQISKWLFDNNDTILLQSFIFDYYYMNSILIDSYDYKSMVKELDTFKEIDNKNLFRHKFKDANWFSNHVNELINSKSDKLLVISYANLTKKQSLFNKVSLNTPAVNGLVNGSQSGGKKKTKRVKLIKKH